jgi:hypothetical protein
MRRGNLVVETGINEGRSEHRSCSVWRATMSEHHATIDWKRETPDFAYETYNRDHDWQFDAGVTVRASATPAYLGSESCVDPEEAFVASLSSCHMLTFLAIACKKRFTVGGVCCRSSHPLRWCRFTIRQTLGALHPLLAAGATLRDNGRDEVR